MEFNEDNTLMPQRVRKCELAFFYGKCPRSFRTEIGRFMCPQPNTLYYSAKEVQRILEHLGSITRADVENAAEKIAAYYEKLKQKTKRKNLK